MASYTPNYNLKKPADSDSYDIADANGNMDIIDGALNTLNSKLTRVHGNLTPIVTPTRADVATYSHNGGCCTIAINNVAFGSSFSSDTAVFRCPYTPPVITRFLLVDSSGALLICFVDSNNGDVKINGYTAGRLLYGSVTFVV